MQFAFTLPSLITWDTEYFPFLVSSIKDAAGLMNQAPRGEKSIIHWLVHVSKIRNIIMVIAINDHFTSFRRKISLQDTDGAPQ